MFTVFTPFPISHPFVYPTHPLPLEMCIYIKQINKSYLLHPFTVADMYVFWGLTI